MSKYNINFRRLALMLLPTFWRKPLLGAFAYALVAPLSLLHVRFMSYREEKRYRLYHNGQICYLRAVLNDRFDMTNRRIQIVDNDREEMDSVVYRRGNERVFRLYRRGEETKAYIPRRGFFGAGAINFTVELPRALQGNIDEDALTALVDMYRPASMRYGIIYK